MRAMYWRRNMSGRRDRPLYDVIRSMRLTSSCPLATPRCVLAPRTRTRAEHSDNASQSDSLLEWIINSRRRLSERDVRPLAQQLVHTLSLIHAHGVVHRSTVSSLLPHDTHIIRKPCHHRSQTRKHLCNSPQSTTPCHHHGFYIRSGHCSRR